MQSTLQNGDGLGVAIQGQSKGSLRGEVDPGLAPAGAGVRGVRRGSGIAEALRRGASDTAAVAPAGDSSTGGSAPLGKVDVGVGTSTLMFDDAAPDPSSASIGGGYETAGREEANAPTSKMFRSGLGSDSKNTVSRISGMSTDSGRSSTSSASSSFGGSLDEKGLLMKAHAERAEALRGGGGGSGGMVAVAAAAGVGATSVVRLAAGPAKGLYRQDDEDGGGEGDDEADPKGRDMSPRTSPAGQQQLSEYEAALEMRERKLNKRGGATMNAMNAMTFDEIDPELQDAIVGSPPKMGVEGVPRLALEVMRSPHGSDEGASPLMGTLSPDPTKMLDISSPRSAFSRHSSRSGISDMVRDSASTSPRNSYTN